MKKVESACKTPETLTCSGGYRVGRAFAVLFVRAPLLFASTLKWSLDQTRVHVHVGCTPLVQ
jgi:hypothetical protein